MLLEALRAELLSVREQAERVAQDIGETLRSLSEERGLLWQTVQGYNEKRAELLKGMLQACGMTWCTCCSAVIPELEAQLLLVEGVRVSSGGYENSGWGCEPFSKLHRACSNCRQREQNRHGAHGLRDPINGLQEHYYAFCVEERGGDYYARKFGSWVKLDDQNCSLAGPSSEVAQKLTKDWGLPPRIGVEDRDRVVERRG